MSSVQDFLTPSGQFQCISCGACCSFIKPLTERGALPASWAMIDGSCKNLDKRSMQCVIYNYRPNICRVNKTLKPKYSDQEIAAMCKVMKDHQEERSA